MGTLGRHQLPQTPKRKEGLVSLHGGKSRSWLLEPSKAKQCSETPESHHQYSTNCGPMRGQRMWRCLGVSEASWGVVCFQGEADSASFHCLWGPNPVEAGNPLM